MVWVNNKDKQKTNDHFGGTILPMKIEIGTILWVRKPLFLEYLQPSLDQQVKPEVRKRTVTLTTSKCSTCSNLGQAITWGFRWLSADQISSLTF